MHTSSVLRIFVVLEWVAIAGGIVLSILLEPRLPEPLRDWLAAEVEREVDLSEIVLLILAIPMLLGALIGSIGLLFLKRWAAWLYLISLIIGFLIFPFMGPTVEHGMADVFLEVASVISGMIIALAFFSDALPAKPSLPERGNLNDTGTETPDSGA